MDGREGSAGDLDPEVGEGTDGVGWQPTSHLRSREEYLRSLRESAERWLPNMPPPAEWRTPDPTSASASNTSGIGSVADHETQHARRPQDRGQGPRRAPHSFRSRPPFYENPPGGHAIGVGYVALTLRELAGLSQRRIAKAAGTSQGAIARIEGGHHTPSLPFLFRLANTVGYRLVLGFAAPEVAELKPSTVAIDDLALIGVLIHDPLDGLPCFRVVREPPPWGYSM